MTLGNSSQRRELLAWTKSLRLATDLAVQDDQVVVVTEPLLKIFQTLLLRVHGIGPQVLEQLRVIPVVLHALTPLVKVFGPGVSFRCSHRLAASPVCPLQTGQNGLNAVMIETK